MAYEATCVRVNCKYTETYRVQPGVRKCPKCGGTMLSKKA